MSNETTMLKLTITTEEDMVHTMYLGSYDEVTKVLSEENPIAYEVRPVRLKDLRQGKDWRRKPNVPQSME